MVPRYRYVPLQAISIFTRQMSAMLNAGLGIHKVLIFGADSTEGSMAIVLNDLANRVGDGWSLSNAMARHPKVFSPIYVGLIKAGESSGQLLEVVDKLADLTEKQVGLQKKLSSALVYPAFLVSVAGICLYGFLAFILPSMLPMVTTLGVTLPWPTRMLVLVANTLRSPLSLTLIVAAVLGVAIGRPHFRIWLHKNPEIHLRLDQELLRFPVVGPLLYKITVARILYALSATLVGGIPLTRCLDLCRTIAGNAYIAQNLVGVSRDLTNGVPFSSALAENEVMPRSAVLILASAEEASDVSQLVVFLAKMYEEDVELSIATAMSLVEPLLMAFLGLIGGFVAIATMLPLVSLLNKFSQ